MLKHPIFTTAVMCLGLSSLGRTNGLTPTTRATMVELKAEPSAHYSQPCISSTSCRGTWSIDVDALYWRICGDGKLYNLTTEIVPMTSETDIFNRVTPDNEWGVRATVGYTANDRGRFATLSFLYFDEDEFGRTELPTAVSSLPVSNFTLSFIEARVHNEYQRLSGRSVSTSTRAALGAVWIWGGLLDLSRTGEHARRC